jgi:hypothetical protein
VRRYIGLGLALLLAGCGSVQVAAPPARETTGVAASCAGLSPASQFAAARRVFVGVMLPGPMTRYGARVVLGSPARMRVERYVKGAGPRIVRVDTAVTVESDAIGIAEDGILPRAGQRWKIYTRSRRQPFDTSTCDGSTRVVASPALALWRAFPVQAKPRPIVPLGEGVVLDPTNGFSTLAQKIAYLESRFALGTALPPGSALAYGRLRAGGVNEHENVPPLLVIAAKRGSAVFVTDRGRRRLPTWRFYFKGVADPASVLALAPPGVFIPPPLHRFRQSGPGSSIEDSAKLSTSGKTITLSFAGGPAGDAPCDYIYRASAVADPRAVAFTITTIAVPVPPGEACTAIGLIRTAVLHLSRPLGARVLISASDGGAVPVTTARR